MNLFIAMVLLPVVYHFCVRLPARKIEEIIKDYRHV